MRLVNKLTCEDEKGVRKVCGRDAEVMKGQAERKREAKRAR